MKHLTPRDILQVILFLLCFLTIFAVAGYLETAPVSVALWMGGALSIILWIAYIIVVAVQRNREHNRIKLKVMANGKWVDVDSPEGIFALSNAYNGRPKPNVQIFDQDDHIIEKERA